VPDVSTDADPLTGILTYYDGQWISLGGTSASAPTLAAMVALTDASSTCGGSSIGFANPALYASAAKSYVANFTDITTGNNDFTGTSGGLYPAGSGYDMASGLGSPNAASLAPALCEAAGSVTNPGSPVTATNPVSPVTATNSGSPVTVTNPGSQTSLIGTRHSLQIKAAGGHGGPLTYTATGLPPGLMINFSSGLISGTVTRDGTYTVTVGAVDGEHSVGSTGFEWRIDPATVTIANPGAQTGRVGRYLSVQVGARANNAGSLTYTATGLPPGLALRSSSGLISGTPSAAVAGWATVTATTFASPPARTRMRWTIGGNPRLSRSSLAAVAKGKPKLSLWFAAGTYAPLLKTISIAVPRQLAFTGKRRGLAVAANGGKRVVFTNKERKGLLVVTLRSAAPSFRITVGSPAIRAARGLTSAVKHRRRQVLKLTVTATDSSGLGTRFPLRLRPAS
jgi:Putative Ig domain